jgi:hypothetical protein
VKKIGEKIIFDSTNAFGFAPAFSRRNQFLPLIDGCEPVGYAGIFTGHAEHRHHGARCLEFGNELVSRFVSI